MGGRKQSQVTASIISSTRFHCSFTPLTLTMASSAANPIDFTFRVIESVAFALHSLLGISEPFTGCLRGAFRDQNNMVWWGWPVAGCLLAMVSFGNFYFADKNNSMLLAIQWYIVTFHFGAIWYHIRIGHHPAVGIAPGIFIPIALTVIGIRIHSPGWWYILPIGTALCALVARFLCLVLVKPPPDHNESQHPDQALLSGSPRYGTATNDE